MVTLAIAVLIAAVRPCTWTLRKFSNCQEVGLDLAWN